MKQTVALILIIVLLFCSCGGPSHHISRQPGQKGEVAAGQELTCLAEDEQEALSIADQYGIELVSFEAGVAVFHTHRDWNEVIEQGRANGWPELSPNYVLELM